MLEATTGRGKSATTDTIKTMLQEKATKYTSLTLAGLHRIADTLTQYAGHLIIDDLGSEKSLWSRTGTLTSTHIRLYVGDVVNAKHPEPGCGSPYSNRNGTRKPRIHPLRTQNNTRIRNKHNTLQRLSRLEHPASLNEHTRTRRRLDSSRTRQSPAILSLNQTVQTKSVPPNTGNAELEHTKRRHPTLHLAPSDWRLFTDRAGT